MRLAYTFLTECRSKNDLTSVERGKRRRRAWVCRAAGRKSSGVRTIASVSKLERYGSFRDSRLAVASKVEPFRSCDGRHCFEVRTVGVVTHLEPSSRRGFNRSVAKAAGAR